MGPINSSAVEKTPETKKEPADEKLSLTEKIKQEEAAAGEKKKKSMGAWGDTGEKKSFGIWGMLKFTFPRLWIGGCFRKFVVCLNFFFVFAYKGA